MVFTMLIELIPILLGIMFIVNVLEEYKQIGIIVTKLIEGEECLITQQEKHDEQEANANANEICIDENILRERELLVLKRERILDEREQFLKKREDKLNEKKIKKEESVSYTNSSEQYAKKLKTRFR